MQDKQEVINELEQQIRTAEQRRRELRQQLDQIEEEITDLQNEKVRSCIISYKPFEKKWVRIWHTYEDGTVQEDYVFVEKVTSKKYDERLLGWSFDNAHCKLENIKTDEDFCTIGGLRLSTQETEWCGTLYNIELADENKVRELFEENINAITKAFNTTLEGKTLRVADPYEFWKKEQEKKQIRRKVKISEALATFTSSDSNDEECCDEECCDEDVEGEMECCDEDFDGEIDVCDETFDEPREPSCPIRYTAVKRKE